MTKKKLYKNFINRADSVGWDYAIDSLIEDAGVASYEGEIAEIDITRLEAWVDVYTAGYKYLEPNSNDVDGGVCGEFRRTGFKMIRDYLYRLSCIKN